MSTRARRALHVLAVVVVCAGPTRTASAAKVSLRLSARETFVNVPITLEVVLEDADDYEIPRIPEIDGLAVTPTGRPSVLSRRTIINGRISRSKTITFGYRVVPLREGRFEIPPIEVRADGTGLRTRATSLVAIKSDTDDLLFVELKSDRRAAYVGDSLDLTLQIWLRPFRHANYALDGQEMWNTLDQPNSRWGPFQELLESRSGKVTVRETLRADSEGQERSYFLYELHTTIWTDAPGIFEPEPISIVVSYPTQIGRVRDPFDIFSSRRVRVTASRPLAAEATIAPVEIRAVPEDGRPEYFSGAVGRFDFEATAKPREVTVGDPITLTMKVSGQGRMDTLAPPPLSLCPGLGDDFKIPTDPVAGLVDGHSKTFTQSIRPKHESITEIPAIPYSYFDPQKERFEVAWSKPIELTVHPAQTIPIAQIMSNSGGGDPKITELTELRGGILANYTGMEEVLSRQAFAPGWGSAALTGMPPVLFALCLLVRRRRERLQHDQGYARRKSARRVAGRRIREAADARGSDVAEQLTAALAGYVADRCDLPAGGLTRAEVVQQLRRRGASDELIEQLDAVLEACDDHRYGGVGASAGNDLVGRAERCLDRLEQERF